MKTLEPIPKNVAAKILHAIGELPLRLQVDTTLVHTGGMATSKSVVRQSISLPANVAGQVRTMAKKRRLSANRMLIELIEQGIATEKRKQQRFLALAENFRAATDPKEAERLGDELGRMVFGG